MKKLLAIAAFALAIPMAFAQRDNTLYVKDFPGNTVGDKLGNAINSCPGITNVLDPLTGLRARTGNSYCYLVVDPSLVSRAAGQSPTLCDRCLLIDWRNGYPWPTGVNTSGSIVLDGGLGKKPIGVAYVTGGSGAPSIGCSSTTNSGVFYLNTSFALYNCSNVTGTWEWDVVGTGSSGSLPVNNPTYTGNLVGPTTCSGTPGTYCPPAGALLPATVMDARYIAGVDCTGATDSAPALNALTNTQDTISYKTLSFRGCSQIKLQSQWLIHGQENAEIDFGGNINSIAAPSNTSGTIVSGCGGSAGALIKVDRSGDINIHGGTLQAKLSSCSSNFTGGIQFTNSGSGGYTTTAAKVHDIGITTNWQGQKISNFIGVQIYGTPNQDEMVFDNVHVVCQNSTNSYGFDSEDVNADSTKWIHGQISKCYHGFHMGGGAVYVQNTDATGNGGYSIFGGGGATFYEAGGCVSEVKGTIVGEGSGQLLGNDGIHGCGARHWYGSNQFSFQDIDPAKYPVDLMTYGVNGGCNVFESSSFTRVGASVYNNTLFGTTSTGNTDHGAPYACLDTREIGYDTTYLTPAEWTPPVPFQLGETHNEIRQADMLQGYGGMRTKTGNLDEVLYPMAHYYGPTRSPLIKFRAFIGDKTSPNYEDFSLLAMPQGSAAGSFILNYKSNTFALGTLAFQPKFSGAITALPVSAPGAPSITVIGSAGSTTWSYAVVCISGSGSTTAASANGTINTGNATLNSSNYNLITFTFKQGCAAYAIYRTAAGGSPSTTGLIGTVYPTQIDSGQFNGIQFRDTGLPGDATTPPATSTADGRVTGTSVYLSTGQSWTSGSGSPAGSCTSGSLYTNTSGSAGGNNNLYVCSASSWLAVK